MIARISTQLDAPPDAVWAALKKKATFLHVTRGAVSFPGSEDWPEEFREGQRVSARMLFFGVIPAPWAHELRLVSVDDERRELLSNEHGGPLKAWNHRIRVEPLSGDRTLYTDEIQIRAGSLTLPVWIYAHLFYRYRQARWRELARLLSSGYKTTPADKPRQ